MAGKHRTDKIGGKTPRPGARERAGKWHIKRRQKWCPAFSLRESIFVYYWRKRGKISHTTVEKDWDVTSENGCGVPSFDLSWTITTERKNRSAIDSEPMRARLYNAEKVSLILLVLLAYNLVFQTDINRFRWWKTKLKPMYALLEFPVPVQSH